MWAISYFINNHVLCAFDLTLICHLTKIGRNVTFVFLNKNSTKLARSHKSDTSLSILIGELLESVTCGMFSVLFMGVLMDILWNA